MEEKIRDQEVTNLPTETDLRQQEDFEWGPRWSEAGPYLGGDAKLVR